MTDRHTKKRRMLALNPDEDQKLETLRGHMQKQYGISVQRQQVLAKALDLALERLNGTGRNSTSLFDKLAPTALGFGLMGVSA